MLSKASTFTFLQVGDVYLDYVSASSQGLRLTLTKHQHRNKETLACLAKVCGIALEYKAEALFIAGTLFQAQSATIATVEQLVELFACLGDLPVLINPGQEDFLLKQDTVNSCYSLYDDAVLVALGIKPWSSNVHIFTRDKSVPFLHPHRSNVYVTGAVVGKDNNNSISGSQYPISVLLASRLYRQVDSCESVQPIPVTDYELRNLAFSYAALGGSPNFHQVSGQDGVILGAYAGSLTGKTVLETGPRFAVLGKIIVESEKATRVELTPLELDPRRIVVVDCNIGETTSDLIIPHVKTCLEYAGARPTRDIVYLKLSGISSLSEKLRQIYEEFKAKYYHFLVEDKTHPDYLSYKFDQGTAEEQFVQAMLDLKRQFTESDGTATDLALDCELSVEIIEDALSYGLAALKENKVMVRYVD